MTDPKHTPARDDAEGGEDAPELHTETLKDLTPPTERAEDVKGGVTTGRNAGCYNGTW